MQSSIRDMTRTPQSRLYESEQESWKVWGAPEPALVAQAEDVEEDGDEKGGGHEDEEEREGEHMQQHLRGRSHDKEQAESRQSCRS